MSFDYDKNGKGISTQGNGNLGIPTNSRRIYLKRMKR